MTPRREAKRAAEVEAVVRVLRHYGIEIADPVVASEIGAKVLAEAEAVRRRGERVSPSQCGAPTLSGLPCRNERRPGLPGCAIHPRGRRT